jgi:DNA invertase Pin-like site-specific DNA recombinase
VLDLQRDALATAGIAAAPLYEDRATGRRDDRPGLAACPKALRSGDILVIWKLDRLGRDLRHLVNFVHDLTARRVGLKVLAPRGRGRHHDRGGQTCIRDLRGARRCSNAP